MKTAHGDLGLFEAMGLYPPRERFRQALIVLRGEEDVPSTKFSLSSLGQLKPRIGFRLWRGREWMPRTVIISNLFNHRQTPIEDGWSVRKRQALDFRGRDLTYDSHNGTDFAIPVGTEVLTAAAGQVARVASEFNRGGLKVYVDHGHGLMTCTAHLGRSLVREGDFVSRGQPIALSGYSGVDALVTFPFGLPHIHFNVWLNAEPVDPFPQDGKVSLWRGGELPETPPPGDESGAGTASEYSKERIDAGIACCLTAKSRARISAINSLPLRAGALLTEMNYYPTRFPKRVSPYSEQHNRQPLLDLPFAATDFDRVAFIDDL